MTTNDDSGGDPRSSLIGRYRIVQLLKEREACSEYLAERISSEAQRPETGGAAPLSLLRVYPLGLLRRDPKLAVQVEREVAILRRVSSHPFIIGLRDVFTTTLELVVVLEYCEGGELFEVVETFNENAASPGPAKHGDAAKVVGVNAPSGIPRKVVGRLFHELVMAVSYLHSQGFCHRDIKLETILLSGSNQLKLAEFSMAASIAALPSPGAFLGATSPLNTHPVVHQKYSPTLSLSCGSMHYACPEIIDGLDYDGRCADMWSMGVVLFALITGVLPFDGPTDAASATAAAAATGSSSGGMGVPEPSLFDKIRRAEFFLAAHPSFVGLPKDDPVRDLLHSMLQVQPTKRIAMRSLLKHPFWRSCSIESSETVN